MSMCMPSLVDYLEDDGDWQAVMAERTFPVQAPVGQLGPYTVFRLKKEDREYGLDGPSELYMADIQFKLLDGDYGNAHLNAVILSDVLDRFRGPIGDIVVSSIYFMDSRDGDSKDEVLDLYSVICDISVWYTRA